MSPTGPLVAAANRRNEGHTLAAALITQLGRDLLIPSPVLAEVDHPRRMRVGVRAARLFLNAAVARAHRMAFVTAALLRRALAIDTQFASLNVAFVDGCVMAVTERHRLPVLTFDFADSE